MKELKNKTLTLKADDLTGTPTYATLLKVLIAPIQGQSYDLNDIESRLRIGKVLETIKANKDIQLEDADVKYLQNLVKTYRWGVIHQDILDFCAAINNLK